MPNISQYDCCIIIACMKNLQEFLQGYYSKITILNFSQLKNKTILITGASGLVGSNLLTYLNFLNEKEKLNLKIIAIHKSPLEPWMPRSSLIRYIKLDLTTHDLSANLKFDVIIHCATYAQPKKFLEHPRETINLNIGVLFNLLEQAEKNQASFLYLSSAETYGEVDRTNIPTKETHLGNVNTLSERAIYTESKRLAETICYLFSKKIRVKIARALIGYGPGVKYDDKRVIPEFIKKAQEEKKITMMDEGNVQRTFCFITDMVEMLLNILLNGKEIVYNVCGQDTTIIKDLAKLITQINEAKFDYKFNKETIKGTPLVLTLDNNRYLSEFNKREFTPLNEGLEVTSQWFQNLKQ